MASFVRNPLALKTPLLRHFVYGWCFRVTPALVRTRALLGKHATPALREMAAAAVAGIPPRVLACRVQAVLSVDVRPQLRACRAPVLYLRAADDHVVHRRNAAEVVAHCPAAKVVTLAAPHLLLQVRPAEAAATIGTFLTDNLSTAL